MKSLVFIKYQISFHHQKSKNSISTSIDFKNNLSISVNSNTINHENLILSSTDYITKSYRHIYDNILIIEYPLIREELIAIEKDLEKASTVMTLNIDTGMY